MLQIVAAWEADVVQRVQIRSKSLLSLILLGEQAAQKVSLQTRQWCRGFNLLFPSFLPHDEQSWLNDHPRINENESTVLDLIVRV